MLLVNSICRFQALKGGAEKRWVFQHNTKRIGIFTSPYILLNDVLYSEKKMRSWTLYFFHNYLSSQRQNHKEFDTNNKGFLIKIEEKNTHHQGIDKNARNTQKCVTDVTRWSRKNTTQVLSLSLILQLCIEMQLPKGLSSCTFSRVK